MKLFALNVPLTASFSEALITHVAAACVGSSNATVNFSPALMIGLSIEKPSTIVAEGGVIQSPQAGVDSLFPSSDTADTPIRIRPPFSKSYGAPTTYAAHEVVAVHNTSSQYSCCV